MKNGLFEKKYDDWSRRAIFFIKKVESILNAKVKSRFGCKATLYKS